MKKIFFLTILTIFIVSLNFAFAQDENETIITQNITDEDLISQIDETSTSLQTIKLNGVTERYVNGIVYSATFYDTSGNPIKDQSMWFTLDSSDINYGYKVNTDSNGIALLKINASKGNHYLTAYNFVTGDNASDNFKVFDVITGGKDITMYYGDVKTYKVRLFDNDGNPVKANEKVIFYIGDKKQVKLTDKNGYASLKIKSNPGLYYISAIYNNFGIYNTLIVKNVIKSLTSFNSRLVQPTIKYKVKYLGKSKKNKKIKVKFNKKTYATKTNKKGVATFSLKTPKKLGKYMLIASYKNSKISSIYTKYRI